MRWGRIAAALVCVLAAAALVFAISGGGDSSPSDGASLARSGGVSAADVNAAAANPVAVSPMPGTEDASPASQISFLGDPGTHVADVRVVGSSSGVHSGRLESYSTGTGASFLPSHPFVQGERVTVHALAGVGAASQATSTTFTVAHLPTYTHREFPNNPGSAADIQHYVSAPTVTPSTVRVTTPAKPGVSPGDFMLAPYQGMGSPGPMIVDQAGRLVWFQRLPAHDVATNLQVQQYEGRPVLTWWQGRVLQVGFGQGEDLVEDTSYRRVAVIRAGNGYKADLHEIRLTPQGTAWIDVFDPVRMNLSSVHGPSNGLISDSIVEEIDIKTGLVMWEWHALGHIALNESHNPLPPSSYPWDYIHLNSVDPGPSGDVLLSARNSWTLYDVDLHSGGIRWRLGDQRSSFKPGPGARFYWQHDAEFQPGGLISLFDNGSDPPKEKQSRGLLLDPNLSAHTVTLVHQYTNPAKTLLAESQGNMLGLPGGNWLMGYGGLPNLTEYDSSGHVLFDATLGRNVQNFRSYLAPWNATPTGAPSIAAKATSGGLSVYASWNGATAVASWQVLAGSSPSSLAVVTSAPRSGFETTISVKPPASYVAARALDGSGAVLATSPTVKG